MAYVLECHVVFESQADAQDAYDQVRARAVNASVARIGKTGVMSSTSVLIDEASESKKQAEIAQWYMDLFGIIRDGRPDTDDPPSWIQPSGSQDAYPLTDARGEPTRVTHNGKVWQNNTDANTWEPGVSGWDEV